MTTIGLVVFGVLFCTAPAATFKVKEESRTVFLGEDFHIVIPSLNTTEVLFKASQAPVGSEQVLMRDGQVQSSKVQSSKVRVLFQNHLVVERVGQGNDGTYIIKHSDAPGDVKHVILTVRDCFTEQNVKYGESFSIPLSEVSGPVSLEFRPSPMEPNQTAGPMVQVLNKTWTPAVEYTTRLSASEQRVTLHTVIGSDEGSYTILDSEGNLKKRVCLNVKEHQNFEHLSYGSTLKINLIVDSSSVKVLYTSNHDFKTRLILDQGRLVEPVDPALEGRLSLDGSMCILERIRVSDSGTFRVIDLQGFPVSNVYLETEGYKLPPLFVAIIALVALLVLLLFVCLISCLVKVHRRAQKAKAIKDIAQHAGKEEGDTFRQVVQEAYTRFNEESTTQSQCDSNTQKTEVDIKGLEVSKNLLEMSDSGVEFSAPGLPLDSDTDTPPTYIFPKTVESDHLNSTATPEAKLSSNQTPDSKPVVNQTPDSKPITEKILDSKPDQILVSKPSTDQTLESKPSTDQTFDFNLGANKTPDSKPSISPAPEPILSASSEAAPPNVTPEPAKKGPEPVLNDTPAAKPNMDTTTTNEAHPSGGPTSEAILDAAPPDEKPVTPNQDTSKENAAT